ncbi:valyl-tRNA synthetase [Enhydrobacter aerosaccus]|uniref:Valine--tRNA ligase n=1 Tax=Enhydrobacter aerosaccus TaxID=225324 RepID=A0ABR5IKH1_9HYPH|nr:valine--tRNA ligase [Enhydrobacter aerosaccus]KND21573.1 valyl-tRNA synthetase [Enhydrobacter aerosaccus]
MSTQHQIAQALTSLENAYNPSDVENGMYQVWEDKGYFQPSYDKQQSFSIALPPPNVTGSLHMGHGFNNAIMDTLTRYHRMLGENTLWQPGTDHAGIATQMVVERQLNAQGIKRHDLGREKFLEKIWEWKAESGGNITRQIRRLGSSVDWSRERFTMDDGLSNAVKEVFVRLYEDGLIYRGKRLVNWDTKLQTALSDLEVENHDEKGSLWHFRYYLTDKNAKTQDGKNYLVVATTRPETLLGDTAVAVNPEDARYQHLIGQTVTLPITGRIVPIVGDDKAVDMEFGTGCVKITPAHDFNDYETGKRHNLPMINIFDNSAHILPEMQIFTDLQTKEPQLETTPSEYAGLERFAARKKMVEQSEAEGWLEEIKPHDLKVPKGDRSNTIVEPWLTDQWYVSIEKLAKPAIEAVEDGRTEFVPAQYKNMYMAWMRDIQDWCISRQLWWGHRIPAWYDDEGNIYVARSVYSAYDQAVQHKMQEIQSDDSQQELYKLLSAIHEKYKNLHNQKIADWLEFETLTEEINKLGIHLRQEDDVLDTWFSSALWTFSTLDWTGELNFDDYSQALKTFHPTSVLVTGFDIIFFWVARMMMMTLYFIKDKDGNPQVPFKTVYVHGLVRDGQGQKMSKSKGNVLDPIDLIDGIDLETLVAKRTTGLMNPKDAQKIEKATRKEFADGIPAFGTDALRFTFTSLASTGRDINFDLKRIEGNRNFCNKIWNATRFVLMNCVDKEGNALNIDKTANSALWELPEQWIMSRLNSTVKAIHEHMSQYRFDLVSQDIYEFIWNEYCDWYVELAKSSLNDESVSAERKAQIRYVLLNCLEVAMRFTHPIMPYITESIWQTIAPIIDKKATDSIMTAAFPTADDSLISLQTEHDMTWLQALIGAIRNIRGEMKLGNAVRLPVLLDNISDEETARLSRIENQFKSLAKVDTLTIVNAGDGADKELPLSSSSMVGQLKVLVPMKGLIDPTAELNRLAKAQEKLTKQAESLRSKLSNESFVSKAPANVVESEKAKLAEMDTQLAEMNKQIEQLKAI